MYAVNLGDKILTAILTLSGLRDNPTMTVRKVLIFESSLVIRITHTPTRTPHMIMR